MTERLWTGWRAAYVRGETADGAETLGSEANSPSVFRRLLESGRSDEETHIVHRGDTVFAIVNIHPYTAGHLLVVPYREVADLVDLSDDERIELWATVSSAVEVVRRAYRPDGVNVGLNLGRAAGGSVPTHLHVHVVPRWLGDTNFMAAVADTQTIPESIGETTRRLRSAWVG